MFALIYIKPNITHVMEVVSQYMANPNLEHWKAIRRIPIYVNSTLDDALYYEESNFIVSGHVNANYVGDYDKS